MKYELSEEQFKILASYNRSKNQSQFLFQLLEGNFEKMLKLENKIKTRFVFYCPGDIEEVEKIMKM